MTQQVPFMPLGLSPGQQAFILWIDATGARNILTFDLVRSEDWDEGATVTEHPVETGADIADHVRVSLQKCTLSIRSINEPLNDGGPDADQPIRGSVTLDVPGIDFIADTESLTFFVWQNNILARALAATAGGAVGSAIGGQAGGAIGAIGGAALANALLDGGKQAVSVDVTLGPGDPAKVLSPVSVQIDQWPGKDYVEATHALLVQLKNQAQLFTVYGSKQNCPNMVIESLSFHRDAETGTGEDISIGFKEVRIVSSQTVTVPIPNLSGGGATPLAEHGQQELADAQMADTPTVNAQRMLTIQQQVTNSPLPVGFTIPGLNPGEL